MEFPATLKSRGDMSPVDPMADAHACSYLIYTLQFIAMRRNVKPSFDYQLFKLTQ